MPGLGDEFRAAREARHLSLSDVSEQIHIRSVYLEAIENDDLTFAAPVYVRGFIRTYARYLGLNSEAIVGQFNAALGSGSVRAHESVNLGRSARRRGPSVWLALAGTVAVLLLGLVAYRYVQLQREPGSSTVAVRATAAPSEAPAARSSTPASSATIAPSPVPTTSAASSAFPSAIGSAKPARPATASAGARATLQIRLTADSWTSITVDGTTVFEGLAKAGSSQAYRGKSATVRAGNAGGVDVTLNGKSLGKMGASGDVVERTFKLAE